MASSPKLASLFFFFVFTTLVFSLQTQARDRQIFNNVARNPDPTSTNPKSNAQEPSVKENEVDEEEPSFLPQTAGTGYGLYGHETGLDSPTTTTTTTTTINNNNNDNEIVHHHDQKNYATELKGLSINGFSDGTPTKNDFYNKKNDNNIHGGERKYDYNYNHHHGGVRYNGGVEKQGMSDTRYMDNGKYFYDTDDQAEKNKFDHQYYNDHYYLSNYKPYHKNYYNNYYHKDGYFRHFDHGNNNYGEFNYNKYYRNRDSMQRGYQNQMQQEEEFDFDP